MSGAGRVGIREVAEAAGVSVTTVSHALSGKGRLNEETRRRVREVAEQLGYHPNALARGLAGGRTGLIGLAIAEDTEGRYAFADFAFYTQLMSAAASAALDRGYAIVLASGAEPGRWRGVAIDGAIVVDPRPQDALCREFRAHGLPIVTVGREIGSDEGYWADNDHPLATWTVLDHIAERGAERIGLLASPPVNSYSADTRSGYEGWCAAHGREPIVVVAGDWTERSGFEAMQELLAAPVPPDAIYATLDWLALGAMRAIQASGLSVPEDVMVAGATDSEAARWSRPSLTVLALDPGRIAQAAVAMLAELIEGREPRTRHVLIPTRILARASTRRTISAAAPAGRERG